VSTRSLEPTAPDAAAPRLDGRRQRSQPGSTQKSGFIVQDDTHRDAFQQTAHTPFGGEGLQESRSLKLGKNLRSNASADENTPGRHRLERQISGFRTVQRNKQIHGLHAQLATVL